MFCPKCGASEQSPDSFCRQCGAWLVDPDARSAGGLFRTSTREEKLRKIRTLEVISVGLSLTSASILFAFLFGSLDRGLLFLAMACGILVAVYQVVTMYLGHKVTKTLPGQRPSQARESETTPVLELPGASTLRLNVPASVTDDTTELLDPFPQNRSDKARGRE